VGVKRRFLAALGMTALKGGKSCGGAAPLSFGGCVKRRSFLTPEAFPVNNPQIYLGVRR
jgi:hypothetical protein